MSTPRNDNVIVVGAGFAGLTVAHRILREIKPRPHVTLVNPSKRFYYSISMPRVLVRPDIISRDKVTPEFVDRFDQYGDMFDFRLAYARRLNPAARTLEIEEVTSEEGDTRPEDEAIVGGKGSGCKPSSSPPMSSERPRATLSYTVLVIATGGSSMELIWSPSGPVEQARQRLADLHDRLEEARSIVVGGGGSLGIEAAGEIGSRHGKTKDVTIYSGGERLLPKERRDLGYTAEGYFTGMGVKVIHQLKIIKVELVDAIADNGQGDGSNNTDNPNTSSDQVKHNDLPKQTRLTFDDGSVSTVDLYLSTTGLKPNTDFVPAQLLNENSRVEVDAHLRVTGSSWIYAIGYPASYSRGIIIDIRNAVPALLDAVAFDLAKERGDGDGDGEPSKTFHRSDKSTILIPVGRSKGVGVINGWRVPSSIVWLIKGRNYFVEFIGRFLNGKG